VIPVPKMTPGLANAILSGEALWLVLVGRCPPRSGIRKLYAFPLKNVAVARSSTVTYQIPALTVDESVTITGAAFAKEEVNGDFTHLMTIDMQPKEVLLTKDSTFNMTNLSIEVT
jgi:hypothetical protein